MREAPQKVGFLVTPPPPVAIEALAATKTARRSIASLTDAEAMNLGRAAGRKAFETAMEAGIPVSMKVGSRIAVVNPLPDTPVSRSAR